MPEKKVSSIIKKFSTEKSGSIQKSSRSKKKSKKIS